MPFSSRFHDPIRRGEVTLTVRRWLRPQAKLGGRYRLHSGGAIEVTEVREVDDEALTASVARQAGFASREALVADLPSKVGSALDLVAFRYIGDLSDPRKALAAQGALSEAERNYLARRLDRMDGGKSGVWTRETLRLIGAARGPARGESRSAARAGNAAVQGGRAPPERARFNGEPRGGLPPQSSRSRVPRCALGVRGPACGRTHSPRYSLGGEPEEIA